MSLPGPSAPPMPAVSWLVCTNVVDDHLRSALRSCLEQSFSDFELIVIANGLDRAKIVETVQAWFGTDSRLRVMSTGIRHLNFSLNLGLHACRADLIARMDGDDLSSPDRLRHQVAFMRDHPDVVVLGTNYELIDSNGRKLKRVTLHEHDDQIRRALVTGNPLCHPSVMFRRDALLTNGGFLGGLHAEDYDLWCRLALNKANRFANLPEVCLSYRSVGGGNSRRNRHAYATMAGAQWRNFLLGAGVKWAFGAAISTAKAFVRSAGSSKTE